MKYITKYITKISKSGLGMRGVHIIGSWGNGRTKKMRMVCRRCGSYFSPLWDYDYGVEEYVCVDFIELDDYG